MKLSRLDFKLIYPETKEPVDINELQYVMEHHFHTVQDTVGVNTNAHVEVTRHYG